MSFKKKWFVSTQFVRLYCLRHINTCWKESINRPTTCAQVYFSHNTQSIYLYLNKYFFILKIIDGTKIDDVFIRKWKFLVYCVMHIKGGIRSRKIYSLNLQTNSKQQKKYYLSTKKNCRTFFKRIFSFLWF